MAGTGYFYTVKRLKTSPKITLLKLDPLVKQQVLFSEEGPPPFDKEAALEDLAMKENSNR